VYLQTWPEDMKKAARAKYAQWEEGQKILLLTRDAKLIHLMKIRGKPSVFHRFRHLEEIRDSYKANDMEDAVEQIDRAFDVKVVKQEAWEATKEETLKLSMKNARQEIQYPHQINHLPDIYRGP